MGIDRDNGVPQGSGMRAGLVEWEWKCEIDWGDVNDIGIGLDGDKAGCRKETMDERRVRSLMGS
jgi:hypothetical protein